MSKSRVPLEIIGPGGSKDSRLCCSATGLWNTPNLGTSPRSTIKLGELLSPLHFMAAIASTPMHHVMIAMALTPMTAVTDPWRSDGLDKNAFVETWREFRVRKISLRDARRLALSTMENAELARTKLVDAESELVSRLEG